MVIEVTTSPTADDLERVSEGIRAYNRTVPGVPEASDELFFAVFARNAAGEVVGGIRARAFWDYLCIELLWLSEAARGNGTGKSLLQHAEAFALQHGYKRARVETTSFQARPFYERQGYRLFGVLDDFPEGYTTFYLRKDLQAPR